MQSVGEGEKAGDTKLIYGSSLRICLRYGLALLRWSTRKSEVNFCSPFTTRDVWGSTPWTRKFS